MGTWSLPQTKKEAEKLSKIMESPLKAKNANKKIYLLLGDDELSEQIDSVAEINPNTDVRILVANSLETFLNQQDLAFNPWCPEAVEICYDIVKKFSN